MSQQWRELDVTMFQGYGIGDRSRLCQENLLFHLVSAGSLDGIQFVAGLVSVVRDAASLESRWRNSETLSCCSSSSSVLSWPLLVACAMTWPAPTRLPQETACTRSNQNRRGLLGFLLDSISQRCYGPALNQEEETVRFRSVSRWEGKG